MILALSLLAVGFALVLAEVFFPYHEAWFNKDGVSSIELSFDGTHHKFGYWDPARLLE